MYTAGRRRARVLGVIGALLLFADYTITASLSAVEAFHYFGLEDQYPAAQVDSAGGGEAGHGAAAAGGAGGEGGAGDYIKIPERKGASEASELWHWNSPGVWAMGAIVVLGAFNLMGPKHTAGFAIFAALGMMLITLLIVVVAVPQIEWGAVDWGRFWHPPGEMWHGFVYIVLALSGVEAIANLTGVMKKPVFETAKKSIYIVAFEVALLNLLLAVVMVSLATPEVAAREGVATLTRESHAEDMLAYMARAYIGPWGEWPVRILGGLLLLSATNTAINGIMSILYVMSRDGEMPAVFQKLNGFGAPWVGALLAAAIPAAVLLFFHDLETLASLYAIGVVGAVALDCLLASVHPRMRQVWRKIAIGMLGLFLVAVWTTLATTKIPALIFVTIVMGVGLGMRQLTRAYARRRPKPPLLVQAIREQLTAEALVMPKVLLATAGSDQLAPAAMELCKREGKALVVAFVREVSLSYKAEGRPGLETDVAAQRMFADFLEHGHREGVPIIPVYDTGPDSTVLIAETAAIYGCESVLIGTSRRGALYKLVKGSFQRKLESLLPPEIPVRVVEMGDPTPGGVAA